MIVHRDYRDSSANIIKIFDDRIEFFNPGSLFGGITIELLLSGNYSSKTRNKLVAKVFKEIGLIERYGSGIMRVRRICKEYGIIEPKFEEVFNGFRVILFKEKLTVAEDVTKNDTDNDTDKVTEKVTEKVTGNQDRIIQLITKRATITSVELSKIIGISERKIKENIKKLKEKGIIKRIGPDKGGYWLVMGKTK
jgi:ATP-dependent DNA helicase RecG